jgi:hypothetical protein
MPTHYQKGKCESSKFQGEEKELAAQGFGLCAQTNAYCSHLASEILLPNESIGAAGVRPNGIDGFVTKR